MSGENRTLGEKAAELEQAWDQARCSFENATPKVSAITTLFETRNLNINMMREMAQDWDMYTLVKNKMFLNSVQLKHKDGKGIKLFSNGKIHITGSKSIMDSYKTAVELVDEINFNLLAEIELVDVTVLMYNITIKLDKNIMLDSFYSACTQEPNVVAKYDPIKYSGLILKFTKPETDRACCSLTYFSTGTVFCNGVKEPADILLAYQHIVNKSKAFLLERVIVEKIKGKRGRKRKAEHMEFYQSLNL